MNLRKKATFAVAFFLLFNSISVGQSQELSFRGIWIIRSSLKSKVEIDKALNFASEQKFNHVFVQVRGRGDAFYNSKLVPPANAIRKNSFDPLAYAVMKGHELGLKVHAWVNVYLLWSAKFKPNSEKHLFNLHPEWLDESSLIDYNAIENNNNHNNGGDPKYLSPLLIEVQDHLIDVFREIVANYDIDGLHLDYVRYRNVEYGYNSIVRMRLKQALGIDPLWLYESTSDAVAKNELDKLRSEWNQIRRDSISSFVRRCRKMIQSLNPSCLLSAAVKPNLENAKKRYFQEWDRWLAEGLVDYVAPMNYDTSLRKFADNIDIIYDNIPPKYISGIVMGIAAYNQDAIDVKDKVKYAKVTGISGVLLFSYDSHKNDLKFFAPIVDEMNR